MPVPSLVTDLSTTAASNSPAGSDNVFPDLDNYLRALSAFMASIRDNSGNGWVSPYLPLAGGTVTGATTFSNTVTGTKFIPTGTSATGNGMYLPATNTLGFSTNGAEVARLDSSGNLGLGVTPSAWQNIYKSLDIGNSASIWTNTSINNTVVSNNAYINSAGSFVYKTSSFATGYSQNEFGQHRWLIAGSGTAGNTFSFTQAMTLDASGNLGIGTSSPAYKLDVSGDVNASNYVILNNGTTLAGTTGFTNANGPSIQYWGSASAQSGALVFNTAGTERARITSGGDLLVGATATGTNFDGKLNVAGRIHAKAASGTTSLHFVWNESTTGNNGFIDFGTEGTYTSRGGITYNRAGGLVAYNTTSDYRAKDIIGPVQNPGATIDALKVYEGVMKGATQSRPMLVAHEAQEHAPYAVSGVKDEVNEDGTPKFQQMDVSSLVPLLLAEIQSLRARVAALEAA